MRISNSTVIQPWSALTFVAFLEVSMLDASYGTAFDPSSRGGLSFATFPDQIWIARSLPGRRGGGGRCPCTRGCFGPFGLCECRSGSHVFDKWGSGWRLLMVLCWTPLLKPDSIEAHLSSYGSGGGTVNLPVRVVADSRVTFDLRNTRRHDDSLWNPTVQDLEVCRD